MQSIYTLPVKYVGGVPARRGFEFQDHIAAGLCLEMLVEPSLKEVWCESHDDVTLIWEKDTKKLVEFVQVKTSSSDRLWSLARICSPTAGTEANGTSILEKSLSQDCCSEEVIFRIVTDIGVADKLAFLKLPIGSQDRSAQSEARDTARSEIVERLGEAKSDNGLCAHDWIDVVTWEVKSQLDAIADVNKWKLSKAIQARSQFLAPDQIDELYAKLLRLVQDAALSTHVEEKRLSSESISQWLSAEVDVALFPYGSDGASKLVEKMELAALPDDYIRTAKLERIQFRYRRMQSQYLNLSHKQLIDIRVTTALRNLRSQLDSGAVEDNGIKFHALCINELTDIRRQLAASIPTDDSYLAGCMYDITDRCLHRFRKY